MIEFAYRKKNGLSAIILAEDGTESKWYTAISRKVVAKTVHATIPKGNMGYDQYTCS